MLCDSDGMLLSQKVFRFLDSRKSAKQRNQTARERERKPYEKTCFHNECTPQRWVFVRSRPQMHAFVAIVTQDRRTNSVFSYNYLSMMIVVRFGWFYLFRISNTYNTHTHKNKISIVERVKLLRDKEREMMIRHTIWQLSQFSTKDLFILTVVFDRASYWTNLTQTTVLRSNARTRE